MIPIKDDNKCVRFPYVTYTLILVNVLCWIFVQEWGFGNAYKSSVLKYGLIPTSIISSWQKEAITAITSMFMHGSLIHLFGNMWTLYIFGDNIEDKIGHWFFLTVYFVSGLYANIFHIFTHLESNIPVVGSSGAISGIIGGYIVLFPKAPVELLLTLGLYAKRIVVPASLFIGYWFIFQLVFTLPMFKKHFTQIAFWAHIGGFIIGFVILQAFKLLIFNKKFDHSVLQ